MDSVKTIKAETDKAQDKIKGIIRQLEITIGHKVFAVRGELLANGEHSVTTQVDMFDNFKTPSKLVKPEKKIEIVK